MSKAKTLFDSEQARAGVTKSAIAEELGVSLSSLLNALRGDRPNWNVARSLVSWLYGRKLNWLPVAVSLLGRQAYLPLYWLKSEEDREKVIRYALELWEKEQGGRNGRV